MSFTLLSSRFSVRVQVRVRPAADAAANLNPGTSNFEQNLKVNTNREVSTEK
jgi:hypothetical protein